MSPIILIRDAVDDGVPNPQGHALVVVSLLFGVIASLFVITRWITRIGINKLVGADDWFILAALTADLALMGVACRAASLGLGLHGSKLDPKHAETVLELVLTFQILFKAATMLTKVSILLLFLRIFTTSRPFRITCWITIAVVVAFGTSIIIASIFQCTPLQKSYEPWVPGKCIVVGDVWYAHGGFAVLSDIWIIIWPLRQIQKLNLPKVQKVGLVGIFSIGIFVIITEIVRLCMLGPVTTSSDTIYYQASAFLWAGLEANVGIMCACAPMLRGPLQHFRDHYFTRNRLSGTAYSSKPILSSKEKDGRTQPPSHNRASFPYGKERKKSNDEETMLEGKGILKTNDIRIHYSENELPPPPPTFSSFTDFILPDRPFA